MSDALDSAVSLIRLQGRINERIIGLTLLLKRMPQIKSATRICEVRRYPNKTVFEVCVDVETDRDVAVSFWFEFGWEDERWRVVSSISRTEREGQTILEEYPESFPTSIEQLETEVTQASEWLVKRGKEFNFEQLK